MKSLFSLVLFTSFLVSRANGAPLTDDFGSAHLDTRSTGVIDGIRDGIGNALGGAVGSATGVVKGALGSATGAVKGAVGSGTGAVKGGAGAVGAVAGL